MNRIEPTTLPTGPAPVVTDPEEIAERHSDLLGDESRLRAGSVRAIHFPASAAELAGALRAVQDAGQTCVLSAGRTGITGAAVPLGADAVVTVSRMNRLLALGRDGETWTVRAEPGLTLQDLDAALARREVPDAPGATDAEREAAAAYADDPALRLWLPVDPTETTAELGGAVATNASGARSFRHGPIRQWVRALRVVLPDGTGFRVRRGEITAGPEGFRIVRPDGSGTDVPLPEVAAPRTKQSLGYAVRPGMDLVDLLVGSEGTLGAFSEIELALAPRPEAVLGVVCVLPDEAAALDLVTAVRARADLPLEALEYFDPAALRLLRAKREAEGPESTVSDLPSWEGAAVYLELAGTEAETEAALEPLAEALEAAGSRLDDTWAETDAAGHERQKAFRHAVPEEVNALIGRRQQAVPALHKVGTDMAVPDEALRGVVGLYRRDLEAAGLESVVFGHVGDNHLHVNILPRSEEELAAAKALYLDWARAVVRMGGAVSAEHGIGRIKKPMLELQYPPEVLDAFRAIRRAFDPRGTLAPGVLL